MHNSKALHVKTFWNCYSHLPFFFLNYRQFSASFYFPTHRVCLSNAASCHNVTGHPDATFGCKLYKTKTRMFDSTGFTCLTLSRNTCATLEAFQMVPCGWDVILQGNSHDISTVGWCKAWFSIILNSLPNWLIWCCDVSLLSPMRPLGEVDRKETGGAAGRRCLNSESCLLSTWISRTAVISGLNVRKKNCLTSHLST